MSRAPARIGMAPPHPGVFIREEILAELGLSITEAAKVLNVRRATLSPHQWQWRPLGGNGVARREGLRHEDGDAAQYAGLV